MEDKDVVKEEPSIEEKKEEPITEPIKEEVPVVEETKRNLKHLRLSNGHSLVFSLQSLQLLLQALYLE